MGFWEDQWMQLRGHIKFRLLEIIIGGSGAIVIATVAYLQHVFKNLPEWVFPSSVFLVSLCMFLYAVRKLSRCTEPTTSQKAIAGQQPSKLLIDSASYAAIDGEGYKYDVAEFLRQITTCDSLVLDDIQNHSFKVNGKDFVPKDPKPYTNKLLRIAYSYANGPTITIERPEGHRLVLPEDSYLVGTIPLQLEAVRLSMDLLEFLRRLGPAPLPKYSAEQIQRMPMAEATKLIEGNDGDYAEACHFHFGEIMDPLDTEGNPVGIANQAYQKQIKISSLRMYSRQVEVKAKLEQSNIQKRISDLRNRLMLEGFMDEALKLKIDDNQDEKWVRDTAHALWSLAYKVVEKGRP